MQRQSNPILVAPRDLPGSLVSFETTLVLYLFASLYKGDPRFAWIPIDPTGMFFALSVVVGTFIIVRKPIYKKGLPVVFAMVCLITWLMVSLVWSPSKAYGPDKVQFMGTLALWALISGALIIAPDPERLRRLFTLLLLLALWLGVEALLAYAASGGRVTRIQDVGSGTYLALGRICGLGALVALTAWLAGEGSKARWIYLGLFGALGFVLATAGGRGPLLGTALPLLIPVALSIRLTQRRILYRRALLSVFALMLTAVAGMAVYTTVTDQRLGTIERLLQLTEEDIGGSAQIRAGHYQTAGKLWPQAPVIGHGVGSWPLLTGWPDVKIHPHNAFLELLSENGLIGAGLFLALLATAFRSMTFEQLRSDPQALCATLLFASTFLNAMVTSDLPGNRAMFMMIGVLALFAIRSPVRRRQHHHVGMPTSIAHSSRSN